LLSPRTICHLERSEGSRCVLAAATLMVRATT
jgi:hypothetical protein